MWAISLSRLTERLGLRVSAAGWLESNRGGCIGEVPVAALRA